MSLTHITFHFAAKDHFLKHKFREMVTKALIDQGLESIASEFDDKAIRLKTAKAIFALAEKYVVIDGINHQHIHDDLGSLACGLDPTLQKRLKDLAEEEKNEAQRHLERAKYVPLHKTIEKGSKSIAEDIMAGRLKKPSDEETIKALKYYANTGQAVPAPVLKNSAPHNDEVCMAIMDLFPTVGHLKRQGYCPSGSIQPVDLHENTEEMMFEQRPTAMLNYEGVTRAYVLDEIERNGALIEYVKKQDEGLCFAAVSKTATALQHCQFLSRRVLEKACEENPSSLVYLMADIALDKIVVDEETLLNILDIACAQKSFQGRHHTIGYRSGIGQINTGGIDAFCKRFRPHSVAWTEKVLSHAENCEDLSAYSAPAGIAKVLENLAPVKMDRVLFKRFVKALPKKALRRDEVTDRDIQQIILANPQLIRDLPADRQNEELCLAAVESNGQLLSACHFRTEAVILAAVENDARVFKLVEDAEQTRDICLAVAKKNGYSYGGFKFVDCEIREAAIRSYPKLIFSIDYPTHEERLIAIKENPLIIREFLNPSPDDISVALAEQFSLVCDVKSFRDEDCLAAIKRGAFNTSYLSNIKNWRLVSPEVLFTLSRHVDDRLVSKFEIDDFLGHLPRDDDGREYALRVLGMDGNLLGSIRMAKDEEMCLTAIMNCPDAIIHTPKAFKKSMDESIR